jgi:hypothetical protein
MADVRANVGVPVATQFGGFATPTPCAPLVVNSTTGTIYSLTSANAVVAAQPAVTFGTGVQTALGVNVGTAGSIVVNGGALGTPSSGVATNLTGTASALSIGGNAATVTTNANLTGPITSTGNATAVASQTGTGSKFVMDTGPTIKTPLLDAGATGLQATIGHTAKGYFYDDGSVIFFGTGVNSGAGFQIGATAATIFGPDGTKYLQVTNRGLSVTGLPTSSAGLSSGDIWLNSNVLTIVP